MTSGAEKYLAFLEKGWGVGRGKTSFPVKRGLSPSPQSQSPFIANAAGALKKGKKKLKSVRIDLSLKKIPGIVLLSHSQIYSTIAAGALNYRVREGNECFCSAMDTGKYKTKK